MADLLSGDTAVVTGASSGNGRAIARTFADNGADVVVADIREEPRLGGTPTHELIVEETASQAAYVECDVRSNDDLRAAVDQADEFGGIDVMVNNAGIFAHNEDLFGVDEDEYRTMMDVNAKGPYFGSQYAAERMQESGGGNIINLSSINGDVGTRSNVVYCASKGAVRVMTYALADALGPDIRVNAIHPGMIETAQIVEDYDHLEEEKRQERLETIPLGRQGRPEEIAKAALFLASDLASYVNAASLVVDGGVVNTR
ncbi:SDR family oxidoreductase [Halobellus ruber]|uniref:SDR family oxidoreductase n=1 Tax=Halobellus ruber TaxID=2761102 RepID=A0A7J9SHY5_9EURY|nr:SDR family oxidoreductase [Halobellus ruber]MBB6646574.1 SDR family oxidoreductase [Halobellus ruber]